MTCKRWRDSLEVFLLYSPHTKLWLFSNKVLRLCLQRVFLVELLLVVGLSASELNSRHSSATATQQSTFNSEQWNLFSFSFSFIGSIFIQGLQFMHCRVRDNQWSRGSEGEYRNIPNSPKYRFMTFGCASLQSPLTTLTTIYLQK